VVQLGKQRSVGVHGLLVKVSRMHDGSQQHEQNNPMQAKELRQLLAAVLRIMSVVVG
jgi:hypothetical protein